MCLQSLVGKRKRVFFSQPNGKGIMPGIRGTLVAESAVRSEDLMLRKQRALIQIAALERGQRHAAHRAAVERSVLWCLMGIVVVSLSIHHSVLSLDVQFPAAYAWSSSPTGALDSRYPEPQGSTQVSVQVAAITASYPLIAQLGALAFLMPKIKREGALFILQMVGAYGESRNLKGVHLNGSAEQLRYADLQSFLPTGNASVVKGQPNWSYIWAAWNARTEDGTSSNPFFNTLWQNITEFQLSPAIQDYYGVDTGGSITRPPQRTLIQSLFKGGLAYIASNNFENEVTASQMIKNLMSERYVQEGKPCDALQKTQAAISQGTQWAGYSMIPMGLVGPVVWRRIGPKIATGLLSLIPGLGEVGALAGTIGNVVAVGSVCAAGAVGAAKGAQKKSCGVTTTVRR